MLEVGAPVLLPGFAEFEEDEGPIGFKVSVSKTSSLVLSQARCIQILGTTNGPTPFPWSYY